ncbi:Glyoxylate/hydroxypyruvate reductase A [Phytophthora cinnamomi]|uniref:Glyoxylate/hydroxypyruvate reductase A n=1 Tax=Phytophthora cinnamomi TaxID=4785 RepID=UPI00355980CA|nr:Glyoxylate/hydroxypyruvate reductase A [Phytophthora cinnamomi]
MTSSKLQIPVVSIIPGIGDAVRQQLSAPTAASTPAGKLFQSSQLEIVDLPVPVVRPPNASNNHQPKGAVGAPAPTTPEWKLDPKQQLILEDAEVLFMDAHTAAPLLLAPKTNLPFDLQHLLKKVQWVQGTYAGVDSYHQFPEAPADPGFTVSRAGGIMPTALAQFVFGYVIAIERKLFEAKEYQEKREFARWELKYRSFRQLTVGILGLGDVGQEIGRTFKASGFQVIGFKRRVSDEDRKALASSADRVSNDLSEVLEQSDYVVNVLPSTDATRYLLTENTLEVCRKKQPVFINVGRGDVISEETIVNALEKGLLSKAVLDVFEKEPLPKDSALWTHPKVIVTPHIAGTVFPEDVADVFVKNLNRRLEGKPVLYQMNWSSGY